MEALPALLPPPSTQLQVLPTEEVAAEVIEEVTETAVEIAQIEAERDITIAAIHAETEQAHIEANAERHEYNHEEYEWLRAQVTSLQEQVTSLQQSSIPPPLLEEVLEEVLEEPATMETDLILPSTLEGTSETPMELTPESVEENQVVVVPVQLPARKVRLI